MKEDYISEKGMNELPLFIIEMQLDVFKRLQSSGKTIKEAIEMFESIKNELAQNKNNTPKELNTMSNLNT